MQYKHRATVKVRVRSRVDSIRLPNGVVVEEIRHDHDVNELRDQHEHAHRPRTAVGGELPVTKDPEYHVQHSRQAQGEGGVSYLANGESHGAIGEARDDGRGG